MTPPEAPEPAQTDYEVPYDRIVESLQRQIAQTAATNAMDVAKLQGIIFGLEGQLKESRKLIDELLAISAAKQVGSE